MGADRYSLQTVTKRLQEDAPALLETLPLLPDLILNRLRQTPKGEGARADTRVGYCPATLGALSLGLGIAGSGTDGCCLRRLPALRALH